jgi:hypothetical protein
MTVKLAKLERTYTQPGDTVMLSGEVTLDEVTPDELKVDRFAGITFGCGLKSDVDGNDVVCTIVYDGVKLPVFLDRGEGKMYYYKDAANNPYLKSVE